MASASLTADDQKTEHSDQLEENDVEELSQLEEQVVKSLITELTDETTSTLSTVTYQNVLKKQIAYFSGATHEGCLILTFSSKGLKVIEDENNWEDYDKTMEYLASILSSEQADKGVVILIDCRRNSQHQTIKVLIEKISSSSFPLLCNQVILCKSSGGFSQQVTSYFSKNKVKLYTTEIKDKLKIVTVKDRDDLFQVIPPKLLTDDFGGTLFYDHNQWTNNNILYESIIKLRKKILQRFPDVRDGLNEFEIPQTVKDAERLMSQHLKLKEFFINFFAEIDVCIDQLNDNLTPPGDSSDHQPSLLLPIKTLPILSDSVLPFLNKTNEEVHEEQAEFDKFWSLHKASLDHMMRTCHFKRTIEKVRRLMQGHIDDMTNADISIGESLELSLELGEKHEVFVSTCKEKMDEHMKEIQDEHVQLFKLPGGNEIKNKTILQDLNQIKSSVNSLTELYQELMKLCQQKRDLFIVAVKFHMSVRQCEHWCSTVKEFTEIASLDDMSPERAGQLAEEANDIMKQMTQRQLHSLKEFAACLPEKQVKKLASKTVTKCGSSREKLEQYKTKLLQLVALSYAPPTPPAIPDVEKSTNSFDGVNVPNPLAVEPPQSPDNQKIAKLDNSVDYQDNESDPAILRKREYIFKEVIQTEKDYINDLKIILDSYYHEMVPEERIPLRLRGKRDIIFGNLKEIYNFHNETFLKQMELFSEHPERIGICFIQHSSDFQLYSSYCQNRPNSEALLTESPECQSFFKEIQIRLAHQLPLNSYLIKPIQRITKYQLLLKDMIKGSTNATQSLKDLQAALNIMLQVLKNLNDSLHVVGLKGFPGTLAEQGKLLVHDPFQFWEVVGTSRNLLSRSHERHVFLFEKVIIFSKKREEATQAKSREKSSDSYQYKHHIQLADVQLKDHLAESPLMIVIALHGQNRLYKLQANTREVRDMWAKELKRLLSNQFGLLKDVVLKSGTLDRETAAKFSKMNKRSQGKTKIFNEDMVPDDNRYTEAKKSFSERFKLNIKKKKAEHSLSSHDISNKQDSPNHQVSMAQSLQPAATTKLCVDDIDITASVPARLQTRNRYHSQDDLLDESHIVWSDDEDDTTVTTNNDPYDIVAPDMPHYYTAIADYTPNGADQGIPLQQGQEVDLIGVNQYTGWWWVRSTNYFTQETLEGWVPASYLQLSKFQ